MSKEKHPAVGASALCELLRRQLPPPLSNKVSNEVRQFSVKLSLARFPLFHRSQAYKRWEKWKAAIQALDAIHAECFALSPVNPLMKLSSGEEQQKRQLLIKVDQAIFDCVAVYKRSLFEHPLIRGRIALADGFADRVFFERLALAIRRGVGGHGGVPWLVLSRAATMLEQGMSWVDVFDALLELRNMPPDKIGTRDKEVHDAIVNAWPKDFEPTSKEFYKQLKRHGLIEGRGQKK